MIIILCVFLSLAVFGYGGPVTESYKDQYCTDPRTMKKHAAYSEWADAYSCSRHRCQPGGRNLAIYTVGCKRVEAPESAIECEEVVEDTNIQFPYCCTRLRCLVVVRGEVWTRVLGQPWETLPAAPWSHMYKMKKPPPADGGLKNVGPGLVYELQEDNNDNDAALRSAKKSTPGPECNDTVPRAVPAPDIVIALTTSNDEKEKKHAYPRHKRVKSTTFTNNIEEDIDKDRNDVDFEETAVNEKIPEASDEKVFENSFTQQKDASKRTWTDIPQNQWNEHGPSMSVENSPTPDEKNEKPSGLQELVDAIGNRMRDIETVVQKMSEKVHKETDIDDKISDNEIPNKRITEEQDHDKNQIMPKKPSPNNEHYKRFPGKKRISKYLHSEVITEKPILVEDNNLNGYFSDASNTVRRTNSPKELSLTYVAPVENHRKSHNSDMSDEGEKKHKKHAHKKKRKGKSHKKHHKDDKRKHFNKVTSIELDKNVISLEDSGAVV